MDKIDKIPEEVINRMTSTLPQLKPASPRVVGSQPLGPKKKLSKDILGLFEKYLENSKHALTSEQRPVIIHDFVDGWRILFSDFFEETGEKLLCDFTRSSYCESSFGGYSFDFYPDLIEGFIRQYGSDSRRKLRFMIVCDSGHSSAECNSTAERYLNGLLKIKFPDAHLTKSQRFKKWKEAYTKSDSPVQVRLSNGITNINRNTGVSERPIEAPFNVYADRALSRSIVRALDERQPSPHLEIYIKKDTVTKHKKAFDDLWKASFAFQAKVFAATSNEDLTRLDNDEGRGELFRRWSSLL